MVSLAQVLQIEKHLTRRSPSYFNQGPTGPPQCSGPKSDTQGGITASMPGGSFVGALASGFVRASTDLLDGSLGY